MKPLTFVLLLWFLLLAPQVASAAGHARYGYGVDSNVDALYRLNLDSGEISIIGTLGSEPGRYSTPIALAIRGNDGAIFAGNNSPEVDRGISRVDPSTGKATLVVPFDDLIYSMTFDARDRLIVQFQSGRLGVVDLVTHEVRLFGGDLPILNALAVNPVDGEFYGLSLATFTLEHLHHISEAGTIVATADIPFSPPNGSGTMAFDPAGNLYVVVSGGLFTVDPTTGQRLSDRIPITFPYLPQGFAIGGMNPRAVPTLSAHGGLVLFMGVMMVWFRRVRGDTRWRTR